MKRLTSPRALFVVIPVVVALALIVGAYALLSIRTVPPPTPEKASTLVYNLYATDGYVPLADGTPLHFYGFVGGRQTTPPSPLQYLDQNGRLQILLDGAPAPTGGAITPAEQPLVGQAQFPAPLIYANAGDVIEIHLKNLGSKMSESPEEAQAIQLHVLETDVTKEAMPEPSASAAPANLGVPGAGNVVVYVVRPTRAGTYLYRLSKESDSRTQSSMYGSLVVFEAGSPAVTTGWEALNGLGVLQGQAIVAPTMEMSMGNCPMMAQMQGMSSMQTVTSTMGMCMCPMMAQMMGMSSTMPAIRTINTSTCPMLAQVGQPPAGEQPH